MSSRRIVLSHGDREKYLELEPGKDYLVGRLIEASFFLNDASVSRRHCIIRATTTGVELEDLVSRNSTFFNGQKVMTRTLLSDGGLLQLGKLTFSVRFLDAAPTVPCASCGNAFESSKLIGAPDGKTICASCAEHYVSQGSNRIQEVIEGQGYIVKEAFGGIPATFRVERAGVGKTFTIKAVEIKNLDPERVGQLREDARLLASLDHRSITSVFDVLEVEGVLMLVLATETGERLEALVGRHGALPAPVALEIARRCADAVVHAAARGVVHREITPGNVLVGEGLPDRVDVHVTGFPATRELGELSKSFSAGGVVERLIYMAPEIIQHAREVTVSADMFGVGVVLLYALTGRCPYGEVDPVTHVKSVAQGAVVQPVLDGVPPKLRGLLEKLVATDPAKRPPTPAAMLDLLISASESLKAAMSASSTAGNDRAIQGGFADDELVEYIQLLELNRKTGELEIWGGQASGKLGFHEGKLDWASTNAGLDGIIAARRLLSLPKGTFRFLPGKATGRKGLSVNLAALLLDVLRERDEKKRHG